MVSHLRQNLDLPNRLLNWFFFNFFIDFIHLKLNLFCYFIFYTLAHLAKDHLIQKDPFLNLNILKFKSYFINFH